MIAKKLKREAYVPLILFRTAQDHFIEACKTGDLGALEFVIDALGLTLNEKTSRGRTPLYITCQHGRTATFVYLLTRGADIRIPCDDKKTCLIGASKNGHLEITKFILENMAIDIDEKETEGRSALHYAAERGHLAIVRLLIDHGAKLNKKTEGGRTALECACRFGHLEIVQALVRGGASIFSDMPASPALLIAARAGYPEIVKFLIGVIKRNFPNLQFGYDALVGACHAGHVGMVKLLIESGVEKDSTGDEYSTIDNMAEDTGSEDFHGPLSIASRLGRLDVINYLLGVGFDIEKIDESGYSPLYCAARWGQYDAALLLLDRGARVSGSKGGETALHGSVYRGKLEMLQLLISRGAYLDARDSYDCTAMHIAVIRKRTDLVEFLLKSGASPAKTSRLGRTPIHEAADRNYVDMLKLMTKNLYLHEIDLKDRSKSTPLFLSVRNGNLEAALFLAEMGCNPNIKCRGDSSWESDVDNLQEYGAMVSLYTEYIKHGHLPPSSVLESMQGTDSGEGERSPRNLAVLEQVFFKVHKPQVLLLLWAGREKNPESPFFKDYLPPEVFMMIYEFTSHACLKFEWEGLFKNEN